MTNVIEVDFRDMALRDAKFVAETPDEVKVRCKELLETEDYEEFLLSILDVEYYMKADTVIQELVNAYNDRM